MPCYAFSLRGINVDGRTRVAMADPRALVERDCLDDCPVRAAQEWGTLVPSNPFPAEAKRDAAYLRGRAARAAACAGTRHTNRKG